MTEELLKDKFIYLLKDCYDSNVVFRGLVFNEELTREKRLEIDNKMNEIKNRPEYEADGWQVWEILDELHKCYDFEEVCFEPYWFEI